MVAPPPGVNRPPLLRSHFERIAMATDLPWILQDEPVTTGVKLSPETIIDLAKAIPTLTAVKIEDVPTPSKIHAIHQAYPQLTLFGGLGGLYLLEELHRGAQGSMTGFSYPNMLANILATFKAGDHSGAQSEFFRYLPLIRYEAQLGVRGIAIRKALFYQRGLITSPAVRAPAEPADPIIAEDLSRLVT
ncbi:MAG: dihydrodipicolinate synthase family protein, partial [Firmicutes bacterium]|nr:dihydrodipicolinate synthase family protein [Bacillota bacterium]